MITLLIATSGGFLAGFVGALFGLGGGIIAVPYLNLVLDIPIHRAAALGLISTLAVSSMAAGRYLGFRGPGAPDGLVNIPLALEIELFAALGGLAGGILVGALRGPVIQLVFAAVLIYTAIQIGLSARRTTETAAGTKASGPEARRLLVYALCLLSGILSGVLGIGGGLVVVPVLYLGLGLPFKSATATSNFMMGLTAIPALCGYLARGQLELGLAGPLAAGVLAGASLGAWSMPRIRVGRLKLGFVAVMVFTAVELCRKGISAW